MSIEIKGCTCIGSINASAFVVQSRYMEDAVFDNCDDNDQPFKDWESLIKHLEERYNSGEVYELAAIC